MLKFYENYKKLKETKLKYQEFQHLSGKVLKVKNIAELYEVETKIICSRLLYPKDKNKLSQLCDLKRFHIYEMRKK